MPERGVAGVVRVIQIRRDALPSEHLALKWGDIDWHRGRIMVRSQKTEHLENGDCRILPLFPELRDPLMELFEQAPEDSEYVITRYRDPAQNLRTGLAFATCELVR